MPAKTTLPKSNRLGENIKHYRDRLGLTQLELSHAIGYKGPEAGSYVSHVETGTRLPRLSTLYRIAEALGVSINALTKIS